jgi:cytoskeletal protein CcmA (bactofilin family)
MFPSRLTTLALVTALAAPALAETTMIGGDVYLVDESQSTGAERDLFAVGTRVNIRDAVAQDAHVVGYNVDINAAVGGDLYAAGSSVEIEGDIGDDVSAVGGTVDLESVVTGNARLTGGTVTIDGSISGALIAAGGTVILNGSVDGDAAITAGTLEFGPDARIGGELRYSTSERMEIPASVVPSDRVSYEKLDTSRMREAMSEATGRDWHGDDDDGGSLLAMIGGGILGFAFLLAVGSICLAAMPETVRRLRDRAIARPFMALLAGVAGLSMILGLIPVAAMTLIGLPLLPFIILAIPLVWLAGYLAGIYAVAIRIVEAFNPELTEAPALGQRILILAIAILVVGVLNFVPFLGWMLNLALVLLGIGSIVLSLIERTKPEPELP